MKALGMVRKVDELGRVVLPKELRTTLGMTHNAPVEIFVNGDEIILKKYHYTCCVSGRTDDLVEIEDGRYINREVAATVIEKLK